MQVSLAELEVRISKAISEASPSSGGNLLGFDIDCFYYLDQGTVFEAVRVKRTGNIQRMIEARCRPGRRADKIADIISNLQTLWTDAISYRDSESHSLTQTDKELTLDFVTFLDEGKLFVTGSISVDVSENKVARRNNT